MRLCPRCENMKPDAVFMVPGDERSPGGYNWKEEIVCANQRNMRMWCAHCRTIASQMRRLRTTPPVQVKPIAPTLQDRRLIEIGRLEFKKWKQRQLQREDN